MYGLSHEGVIPHTGIRVAALGWDLGPLYHVAMAPFLYLKPSPLTIHWVNLAICVFGLLAYWKWARVEFGTAPALLSLLLYTQSTGHTAFVDTIWHVGATPGVIFGLIAAAGSWLRTGKTLHLALSGVLLVILIQLHSLGLVFGPAALATLWMGRKQLSKKSLTTLLIAMSVTAIPLLLYLIPSLSDPTMGTARHSGAFEIDLYTFLETLFALLSPRYLLDPITTRFCIIVLITLGTAGVLVSRIATRDTPTAWVRLSKVLTVQILVGAIASASVISYELVGRYFLPVVIPLFVLTGLGAATVNRWLHQNGRTVLGRGLTFTALAGVLIASGPSEVSVLRTLPNAGATLQTAESLDYLLAEEQEAVVSYFVKERGLRWSQMRGRIHGLFFGPNAGVRYFERILRDHRGTPPPSEHLKTHWRIRAEEQGSEIPVSALEQVRLQQRTRTLILERYAPNFDPQTIQVNGRPCGWTLPYIWSQSTVAQLKLVGFPMGHGPDIRQCTEKNKQLAIRLRVSPDADAISVDISIDGGLSANDLQIVIHAEGERDVPLFPEQGIGVSKQQFIARVPRHDGWRDVTIQLPLQRTMGFLDIY